MPDEVSTSTALTVTALLQRAARLFTRQELVEVALDGAWRVHALHELAAAAERFGRGLRASGLPAGAAVATLMGNHRAHVEAQLGVPAAGLALHALSPRHPREALVRSVLGANDRAMLTDAEHLPLARAICQEAGITTLVVAPGAECEGALRWIDVSARGVGVTLDPPREDDVAMLCDAVLRPGHLRTAPCTHRAAVLHAMACTSVDGLALGRRDVILPAMPLYHANGCGLPLVTVLTGARLVLIPANADLQRVRETLHQERVTFAASVTSTWASLAESLRRDPEGPSLPKGLRLMAGGSAAPASLVESLAAQGVTLLQVYGMTETGPLATAAHDGRGQGHAVPLMELRVVDEHGRVAPEGAVGEVQLRSPWVATRYLAEGAAPDRWSEDGWLRTGDHGRRERDGGITLTGRTRPLIRCGGEWIDGAALERVARTHPAVESVAVRCVAHPELVEQPAVIATLRGARAIDGEALRAHIAANWSQGAVPPMVIELRAA